MIHMQCMQVSLLEDGSQPCISVCHCSVRKRSPYISAMLGVARWARLEWTGLRLGGWKLREGGGLMMFSGQVGWVWHG